MCPSIFLSKKQLAREGPGSVAPVVIPSLTPSLDDSLKEDKYLCPVRALCYYLDRTKDRRGGKDLVFVSFKKSFQNDILPCTISSWIKRYSCATSSQMKTPKTYIRSGLTMLGPLQLPKLFKEGFP